MDESSPRVLSPWIADNGRILFSLILLGVIFAPEEPLKFIYTEF